jgi:hypothetical protein
VDLRGYLFCLLLGGLVAVAFAACDRMNGDDCRPRTNPDGSRVTCVVVVR